MIIPDESQFYQEELQKEIPGLVRGLRWAYAMKLIYEHIQGLKEQIKKLEEQKHGS